MSCDHIVMNNIIKGASAFTGVGGVTVLGCNGMSSLSHHACSAAFPLANHINERTLLAYPAEKFAFPLAHPYPDARTAVPLVHQAERLTHPLTSHPWDEGTCFPLTHHQTDESFLLANHRDRT